MIMIDPLKANPHKHAAVIKAWADGAVIEWRHPHKTEQDWEEITIPRWYPDYLYRVKPTPHKWQAVMDAGAAGKAFQYRQCRSVVGEPPRPDTEPGYRWQDWNDPVGALRSTAWNSPYLEFRIKPEVCERYTYSLPFNNGWADQTSYRKPKDNLKLTFEDTKLIKAEVL